MIEKPDQKEDFYMKGLNDVKELLNDKLVATEDDKEEFDMVQLNNIKTDLIKKMGTIGNDDNKEFYTKPFVDMKTVIMENLGSKDEKFSPIDEEELKDPWCDKQGASIN